MAKFVGLVSLLEGWYEKPLRELPQVLRPRVEEEFFPLSWDTLDAEQRRQLAAQLDAQHDPDAEAERAEAFDLTARQSDLERQIQELEVLASRTPQDLESKNRQLTTLRQELAQVKKHLRLAISRSDRSSRTRAGKRHEKPDAHAPGEYVHFLIAAARLNERWSATPKEVAMWLLAGEDEGGLDGYLEAPLRADPPKFRFPDYDGSFDYRGALMHCYFRSEDLEKFVPRDRYLTYAQLVERWRAHISEEEAIALIKAKGETGELDGFHPVTGGVQEAGRWRDEEGFPPIEEGMFWLAQVEGVEAECIPAAKREPVGKGEARARSSAKSEADCREWLKGLMRAGGPPDRPKEQYFKEADRKFSVGKRAFARAWSQAILDTKNTAWAQPGRKSSRRIDTPKKS